MNTTYFSRTLLFFTALFSLGAVAGLVAYAQEETADTPSFVPALEPRPEGLTSCFDFYTFGSVAAVPGSDLVSVMQGVPIVFTIAVTNNNTYPVVDAGVYAKLMRSRGVEKDANGPDVLSFFPIEKDLVLKAGETRLLSYTWEVPADLEPGDYRIVTYVAASDRFNLLGLTFADDIVGNSFDFMVVGDSQGAIRFDKESVTVDGQPYYFAAFPPHVSGTLASVPVSVEIDNTSQAAKEVSVAWKLYAWDALREDMRIEEKTEVIRVLATSSAKLSFDAPVDDAAAVYTLVGSFETESGASSYVNIRFVRDGANSAPRLNDVAVTAYPGEKDTLAFACFHSTAAAPMMDGKVELTVTKADPFGAFLSTIGFGTLASATYEGKIPGEIYALSVPLKEKATSFNVTARIYQDGKLLDEVTVPYRCEDLDGSCKSSSQSLFIGAGVLLLLVIVLLIALSLRKNRSTPTPPTI